VDDVVVVLAPEADATGLPPGVQVAHDPAEGEGPLAGLHAGLVAAPRAERAIVVGGDMPDLQAQVLRELVRVLDEVGVDAVALDDAGRLRPLPSSLRVAPATEAAHALLHAGHRRLRDLFGALRTAVVDEATWTALDPERRTLRDVDEPGDLTD
jgi:molybdenum cofactor guanylyltransferase